MGRVIKETSKGTITKVAGHYSVDEKRDGFTNNITFTDSLDHAEYMLATL